LLADRFTIRDIPKRLARYSPLPNVKVVQRMLGHASAAMTLDVYADLFDDLTAVVEKLDESVGKMGARLWVASKQENRVYHVGAVTD
jgi:hydroxyacyl-ACP dehydratase HTD2-like protein with hotdog domain